MAASFPAGGDTPASNHPQPHHPPTTHSLPQRNVSINVSEPSGQTGGLHPLHHTQGAGSHGPSAGGPKLSRWATLRSDSKESAAPAPSAAPTPAQRQQQGGGQQSQVDSTNKVRLSICLSSLCLSVCLYLIILFWTATCKQCTYMGIVYVSE